MTNEAGSRTFVSAICECSRAWPRRSGVLQPGGILMRYATERRLLQGAVAIAGLVPVSAGAAGVLLGVAMMPGAAATAHDLDSHLRYLSGLLLGIGLVFWSRVPAIEKGPGLFRVLAAIVVVGGLARLLGVLLAGSLSLPMQLALVMELVVTPLLAVWQARVAGRAVSPAR